MATCDGSASARLPLRAGAARARHRGRLAPGGDRAWPGSPRARHPRAPHLVGGRARQSGGDGVTAAGRTVRRAADAMHADVPDARSTMTEAPADPSGDPLAALRATANVTGADVSGGRLLLRPVVARVRRMLARLLSPFLDRQTSYNVATARLLEEILRGIRRLDAAEADIRARAAAADDGVRDALAAAAVEHGRTTDLHGKL